MAAPTEGGGPARLRRTYDWPYDIHSHTNIFVYAITGAANESLRAIAAKRGLKFETAHTAAKNPDGSAIPGLFDCKYNGRAGLVTGFKVAARHDRKALNRVHVTASVTYPAARIGGFVAGGAAFLGYWAFLLSLPSPAPLYNVNGLGIIGGWIAGMLLIFQRMSKGYDEWRLVMIVCAVGGALLALVWQWTLGYLAVSWLLGKFLATRGRSPLAADLEGALEAIDRSVQKVMRPPLGYALATPPPFASYAAPAPPPIPAALPRVAAPAAPGGPLTAACPECSLTVEVGWPVCPNCGLSLVWN